MLLEVRGRLQVSFFETLRSPPVVRMVEVKAAEEVQERHPLTSWIERKRRRLGHDIGQELRCQVRLVILQIANISLESDKGRHVIQITIVKSFKVLLAKM